MSFESGGRADKLGNRYEGRWVAKQLLRLISEEITSVTIEPIGDDEQGVDLWVTFTDGHRRAQQCKARNGSDERWSVSDLNNRGVLSHMRDHLDSEPSCEFELITGIPATSLCDICDSARTSDGNPSHFYEYQIQQTGHPRDTVFRSFCQYLELNPENITDLDKAYDYLRRTWIQLYPYDNNAWQDLLTFTDYALTGLPKVVFSTLCSYVETEDRWGSPIHLDELLSFLRSQRINPRNLAQDDRSVLHPSDWTHRIRTLSLV